MLLEAADAYIKSINKGTVPNVESAWNYICEAENDRLLEDILLELDSSDFRENLKQRIKNGDTNYQIEIIN